MADQRTHWDEIFTLKSNDEMSWFQATPTTSLELLTKWSSHDAPLIDIGAGSSTLVDELIERSWRDVTLLDISAKALADVRRRLATSTVSSAVSYVVADIKVWTPAQHYGVWHDRAVFHFLVEQADQQQYVRTAAQALSSGSPLILATFSTSGPTHCSGLRVARHDPDDLERIFSSSFEMVDSHFEEHTTPMQSVQSFTWVVFRRR